MKDDLSDYELQGYLADFLHMECPNHSETEHQVCM